MADNDSSQADGPIHRGLDATDSSISISGLTDSVDLSGVSGLDDITNLIDDGNRIKDDSKGVLIYF